MRIERRGKGQKKKETYFYLEFNRINGKIDERAHFFFFGHHGNVTTVAENTRTRLM